MTQSETEHFREGAERAADEERDIQAPIDAKEQRSFEDGGKTPEKPKAMQAGAREYPVPPFPQQHQIKPGIEARLDP